MHRFSNVRGVAAMLAATASFVVGDSFMKAVTADLPPFEVLFLRGIAASLACGLMLGALGHLRVIASALNPHALLRAAGETLSVLCYIVALARLPIADAVAILQTAPLILILAVAFLLRERVGAARIGLALVGFAGAFLVAQPGPAGISPPALLAFGSAVLIAARDLIGRDVPAHIPVMVVTFATNVMVTVAAGTMSLAFEHWRPPAAWHLAFLGSAGLFVTLGHVGLLLAYRLGRTAAVAPFFYSFALWAVLSGLIVFGALPNALALAGIALIAGSGAAIVLLDQRRGREIALTEAL
ncbi:MAG TPA: DMT family transporter [Roseiarcus sp.]|nr:DMT family transporter [Roseiarcus sp.]